MEEVGYEWGDGKGGESDGDEGRRGRVGGREGRGEEKRGERERRGREEGREERTG